MRRGAAGLAALATALLVLAAWVTTAGSLPILRGALPTHDRRGGTDRPPPITRPSKPPKKQASGDAFAPDLTIVMYALAILLFLALAALVVHKVVLRRRLQQALAQAAAADPVDDEWQLAAPEGLARSAARGLAALSEGEPRNAIVRCWTELEDAVERLGLARDPALTSEEFTAEVLQVYSVRRSEIETLGALYREARFSVHAMSERHRASAIAALTALSEELRRSSPSEDVPATAPDLSR
jgi:Domain of unknown function (DUF4129)